MKTIVVGYDETEPAKRALEGAAELASAFAAGDPASEIEELAERRGSDLIVVGTHEPSLLARLVGLSV